MSTLLHAPDVWADLAQHAPAETRDWANTLLAVHAPERVRGLPSDPYDSALVMAAGAAGCMDQVRDGLVGDPSDGQVALRCEQLSSMGLLPSPGEDWVALAREGIRDDGDARDLYLAQFLAELDALDGATLAAASKAVSYTHLTLPTILRV